MGTGDSLVIHRQGLSKSYKEVHALKSLDLKVPEKSIFAFLGPNGAGKTTTIKLLLGLTSPTSGDGTIFGKDIVKDNVDIRLTLINLILLFATIGLNEAAAAAAAAGEPPPAAETLMLYGIFGGMFVAFGVMIIMQGVIVGEKKSGTAAWVLSNRKRSNIEKYEPMARVQTEGE